jgi:GntR family transcriptional repressor for pyruvate dehydrogenase complex
MGILDLKHGQGTFVCHDPGEIIERCLNLALLLDKEMVTDFLDARRAVEGGLAYLAARRATDEQVGQLASLVDGMKEAVDASDDAKFEELDVAFHTLVSEISRSSILQYLGGILFVSLDEFIQAMPHTPHGCRRHADVYSAIQARDPDQSQQAMHALVDATAAHIHFLRTNGDKE